MDIGRFCIAGSPYFDMISGAKVENPMQTCLQENCEVQSTWQFGESYR